jgi:alcohol dehydrogenase (cytochrome c)
MFRPRRRHVLVLGLVVAVTSWSLTGVGQTGAKNGEWRAYRGDEASTAYSSADLITKDNVKNLQVAWTWKFDNYGGAASETLNTETTPLMVNGVLYFTVPDHVWAVDARSGREIWHTTWPSKGGWHIANRGVAVLGTTVYVETPDCNLVALDSKDGKEKWRTPICDLEQFY